MQRSKIEIYLHFVWTTKKRAMWVTPDIERRIYRCIGSQVVKCKCRMLAIGGMPDHVHVVSALNSTTSVAFLAQKMKGISALLANEQLGFEGAFDWQDNYAAFSVGNELDAVLNYVRCQKQHHATGDLWTEWEETYEDV